MAAAAVNAIASERGMTARGTLWGVGLGPGDPELVTVKAARVIGEADVVAYHSARHGRSIARGIAEPYLRPGQVEEHLVYPVTTETTDHPGGYAGALEDFYADATRAHRRAPGCRTQRGAAGRGRPAVLQLLHAPAHPADAAVQRRHRAGRDVGERRVGGHRDTAGGRATRCCRCCRARCQSPS